MPKAWLYFIALVLPLIFRVMLVNLAWHEWFWYHQHVETYNMLARLRENTLFLTLIGSWSMPVFVLTVISYWAIEYDDQSIGMQFLLLPIIYVPFSIVGSILANMSVDWGAFISYPLVIIPLGYTYIFAWVILAWVLEKLRIVTIA